MDRPSNSRDLTPPYARALARLIRPFPNWDFFFIRPLRERAVVALQLTAGSRVLDAGCGPGGTFPYLIKAVGPGGEIVGVELSPVTAANARRRIAANRWNNVQVLVHDARSVPLAGLFHGLVMFAAPDVYASPEAVAHLFAHLHDGARVVFFGAKLSTRPSGRWLNVIFRRLMKWSFASTPALTVDPFAAMRERLTDCHVDELMLGSMFLASGTVRPSKNGLTQ